MKGWTIDDFASILHPASLYLLFSFSAAPLPRPANHWWEESESFPFKIRDFRHQSGSFTVKRILY